jgi:hypothetical protein
VINSRFVGSNNWVEMSKNTVFKAKV